MLNSAVDGKEWERLDADLKAIAAEFGKIDLIGSGGNINKLYKLSGQRETGCPGMGVQSLKDIYGELSKLSVEERIERYNLKPDRADVIVPAAHIFLTIADTVSANYIFIPMIGLSDGIIDGLYCERRRVS